MKKNDIFTFITPNGEEVTAVVLAILRVYTTDKEKTFICVYLCYAQNRIFKVVSYYGEIDGETKEWDFSIESVIAENAMLPDYDRMLEDYQHQIDMANDYADKTL